MGLSGAIGDAWEILANVKAWLSWFVRSESAADPGWHVGRALGTGGVAGTSGSVLVVLLLGTSGARYWWCCCCVTRGDHCCFGEVRDVLMTSLLCTSVADASVDNG
jgi:hypothetical protein